MAIYNKIQIYTENTNIKYPLSDTYTEDLTTALLVDAAFSVPAEYTEALRLTNIIRTRSYIFLTVEAATEPIGHLLVTNPRPFVIYPLDTFHKGAAWVVFGPGLDTMCTLKGISIGWDPRCVLPNRETAVKLKLSVNGTEYPMPGILNIDTNYFLTTSKENRPYDDNIAETLTLRRNDLNIATSTLRSGLADLPFDDLPLFTINNTHPDADGNFDLELNTTTPNETATLHPIMERATHADLGFVITTDGVEECIDPYKDLNAKIKKGKEGHGTAYDLPLDIYVDAFTEQSATGTGGTGDDDNNEDDSSSEGGLYYPALPPEDNESSSTESIEGGL